MPNTLVLILLQLMGQLNTVVARIIQDKFYWYGIHCQYLRTSKGIDRQENYYFRNHVFS